MALELQVRAAVVQDLPELVRIYNHYVENTAITFHTKPFSVEERRAWFEGFSAAGPYRLLVAVDDEGVLGYASSSRHKPRAAYDTSVETTVYLDPEATGRGIGKALYGSLLAQLADDPHLHRAYGGVALPNPASIALHEKLGFELAGTFHEIGFKLDRFWDVAWYEKDLSG